MSPSRVNLGKLYSRTYYSQSVCSRSLILLNGTSTRLENQSVCLLCLILS